MASGESANWVEPVVLENEWVRLVPSRPEDAAGLAEIADPATFHLFTSPRAETLDETGLRTFIEKLLSDPTNLAFTVWSPDGQPLGMTTYLDIRAPHRALEIGRTWYTPSARGTKINPACKLLLLEHAFSTLNAVRVQLKTDRRNLHSQNAIAKLGAKLEGTLRQHFIMADGYIRDTVMYSILPDEWPDVKAKLLARLQES